MTAVLLGALVAASAQEGALQIEATLEAGALGEVLEVSARVVDAEGTPQDGLRVAAYSDRDGFLGAAWSADGAAALDLRFATPGDHAVTLIAAGISGDPARADYDVQIALPDAPTVDVRAPSHRESIRAGEPVLLSAQITIPEGRSAQAIWTDAAEGPIALSDAGPLLALSSGDAEIELEISLSPGDHLLVLRVWDDAGQTASALREVHVE